jgi:hypothetical protein
MNRRDTWIKAAIRNWQDLCQAAAEQDQKKLMMLVAEIIETLDDRNRRPEPPVVNRQDRDGSPFPNVYPVARAKDQTCESGLST